MKTCPQCFQVYSDETLNFCLSDGTLLSQSFTDEQTIIRQRPVVAAISSSSRLQAAGVYILLGVLIAALAGSIAYIAFSKDRVPASIPPSKESSLDQPDNGVMTNRIESKSPETSSNVAFQRRLMEETDSGPIKTEITNAIYGWKRASESRDIDATMRFYTDRTHYYLRRDATKEFVRTDKLRFFSKYRNVSVELSNVQIDLSAEGATAQVVFDKEWVFDGDKNFSGKVRQALALRKLNGQWLIDTERDLKVYYVNK